MKKLISLMVALCMLFLAGALLSCSGEMGGDNGEQTTTSDAKSPAEQGNDASDDAAFLVSRLSEIRVIRSTTAPKAVYDAGKALCGELEKVLGFRPAYASDYIQEGTKEFFESEYEILLGECTGREEIDVLGGAMRADDYAYAASGTKIVIRGGTEEALLQAITHFVEKVVKACDGAETSYLYTSEQNYTFRGTYDVDELTLNGSGIGEYTIVYPKNGKLHEKKLAERLAATILAESGYAVAVTDDSKEAAPCEIRIGLTSRDKITDIGVVAENGYKIQKGSGGGVVLFSNDLTGMLGAVETVSAAMSGSNSAKIALDYTTAKQGSRQEVSMSAMSFNILTTTPSDERVGRVVNVILKYMPDTLGLQEVSPYWQSVLVARLSEHYACVGEGRDGGNKGEYNTIFYRKDLFELKESGTKWLSKTPDEISRVDNCSYNRIMTYAVLQRKSDGKQMVHVNTHFEHTTASSRAEQAQILLSLIRRFSDLPVFVTGDFNCTSTEGAYKTIVSGGYADVAQTATVAESAPTFPNGNSVIDFFFANQNVYPTVYEVEQERISQKDPSDHNAIYMKYEI